MLDLVHEDIYENDELKHFGILGMHWGIRRYQNPDGTLTPEGRERYGVKTVAETQKETYSQKKEALKYKKNRSEKEEKMLESLERGEKYFRGHTKYTLKELFSKDYKEAMDWFYSTNYGLGSMQAQVLGGAIGNIAYNAAHYSKWVDEMGFNGKKPSKQSFIEDNWKRVDKEVQNQLEKDKRYSKYVSNKKYYTWDKETGERVDYYTILWNKTQEKLEKEYANKYGK